MTHPAFHCHSRHPRPPWQEWVLWSLGILLALVALAQVWAPPGYSLWRRRPRDYPPVVRPYLDRAREGDPIAMRMLGTMYFNGLNVPQDREEGIRWFRKAAEAGSVAARRDLEQLGLTPPPPRETPAAK